MKCILCNTQLKGKETKFCKKCRKKGNRTLYANGSKKVRIEIRDTTRSRLDYYVNDKTQTRDEAISELLKEAGY